MVRACPRCASRELRPPGLQDGVIVGGGELLGYVCNECGFHGTPFLFDGEAQYLAFRRGIRGGPARERTAAEAGVRYDRR